LLADRLEQAMRAVEVDAVTLLEVRFRLARDDRREMEDGVGPRGDELLRLRADAEKEEPRQLGADQDLLLEETEEDK